MSVCLFVCMLYVLLWCALDGIEGHYSREIAMKYEEYDHIVVSASHGTL